MTSLFHHLYNLIERNAVHTVCKSRIEVSVQRTCCGISVSLDTGNLY